MHPSRGTLGLIRGISIVLALVCACLVVAGGDLLTSGASHHTSPPRRAETGIGFAPVPLRVDPFGASGRRVSLAEASPLAGFTVPVPHALLAGPDSLSKVWFASNPTDDGTAPITVVVLDYDASRVRVQVQRATPALIANPTSGFARTASSLGFPPGSARSIGGHPALVVGASGSQPGFAEMYDNGLDVSVMAGLGAAQLVRIAASIS